MERSGRVDVLINNAGIIQVTPIDHMKRSDYEDAMNTHLWGPLDMMVAALPQMRRQGEGRIVNIPSIGGRIAVPHLVLYSASKIALVGLWDGLRYELAQDNVTVTTVSPGVMRTGSPVNAMFKAARAGPRAVRQLGLAAALELDTKTGIEPSGEVSFAMLPPARKRCIGCLRSPSSGNTDVEGWARLQSVDDHG